MNIDDLLVSWVNGNLSYVAQVLAKARRSDVARFIATMDQKDQILLIRMLERFEE
jgi:hypothetical protein